MWYSQGGLFIVPLESAEEDEFNGMLFAALHNGYDHRGVFKHLFLSDLYS